MILIGGHRFVLDRWTGIDVDLASQQLRQGYSDNLPSNIWERYENPFERKWLWKDKSDLPLAVGVCMSRLENLISLFDWGYSLEPDTTRRFAGAFIYGTGDRLSVHVDAGIFGEYRKAVTAILYLGTANGGALELWQGINCTSSKPYITKWAERIQPKHGTVILFENNDYAWHGVEPYYDFFPRMVLTVSFLTKSKTTGIHNQRERAFFVPRPHEIWTPEMYELRDKRADPEQAAEVYRIDA